MTRIIPPVGQVDLKDKEIPACKKDYDSTSNWVFTRKVVDVSKFKEKLLDMPLSSWEDDNQEGNVKLIRPSHDKWGIKKIVFTFCDDFLLKVLDLPWSFDDSWSNLLNDIYDAIGVDRNKVVRSLLASMPPNVEIPVHHDTGLWVKHTHRIHVPIITNEDVMFCVGPNEDNMKSYSFDEGRIVELNNQAKHYVINRWTQHRVHLIFDYVEDYPISRYMLKPGQVVHQTRRTIDFDELDSSESESSLCPSFVIIGAQKSGTTSLYEYICQHPLVVRGRRRETHYFDWRWNAALLTAKDHLDYYMNFYHKDCMAQHRSLITGESTPSYLLHSDLVIPRMRMVTPHARILVMLRNPVDRAFSHYQMSIDTSAGATPEQMKIRGMSEYLGKTFEDVILGDMDQLAKSGIDANSTYEEFQQKYLCTTPMHHGGHSLLARGLYCLQLEPWLAAFGDQVKVLSLSQLSQSREVTQSREVQTVMDEVFAHIGIPPSDIEDVTAKNTRKYEPMREETRKLLEDFYAPHNERLWALLGYKMEW